jgi:hypothetical protein
MLDNDKTPTVTKTLVTPEMAKNWLATANISNRHIVATHCDRLARDMIHGKWTLTHEGIAFGTDGRLIDGQHRLKAVTIANIPVEMYVWRNVSSDGIMSINNGKPRSLADSMSISGIKISNGNTKIATLRAMVDGFSGASSQKTLTYSEAVDLYFLHEKAIDFACQHTTSKRATVWSAPTRAVIARAFYTADHERLIQFCNCITSGMVTSGDDAAAASLFAYLMRLKATMGAEVGTTARMDKYRKTERSLQAFLARERLMKVYVAPKELFPIPGDK